MNQDQQLRLWAILEGKDINHIAGAPVPVTEVDLIMVAGDAIKVVLAKNHDYKDAWQALGAVGAAARFVDKFFRIENLAGGAEALVVDETIYKTIQDLVGYGLLLLIYNHYKGHHDQE